MESGRVTFESSKYRKKEKAERVSRGSLLIVYRSLVWEVDLV